MALLEKRPQVKALIPKDRCCGLRRGRIIKDSSSSSLLSTDKRCQEEIKMIKVLLNSRGRKDQVKAFEKLKKILGNGQQKHSAAKYLLTGDLVLFLIDSLKSNNCFSESAYQVLAVLATMKECLHHSQLFPILDGILNIMEIFAGQNGSIITLNRALELLSQIYYAAKCSQCYNLVTNSEYTTSVCKCLKNIFKHLSSCKHKVELDALFRASGLLSTIVDLPFFTSTDDIGFLLSAVLDTEKECYKFLSNKATESDLNFTKSVTLKSLAFMIRINLMNLKICSFLHDQCESLALPEFDISRTEVLIADGCNAMLRLVTASMEHVVAPCLMTDMIDEQTTDIWKPFLECLHFLLNLKFLESECVTLARAMASKYLDKLKIAFDKVAGENRDMSCLLLQCLVDILARASIDELDISSHFYPPYESFRLYLEKGMKRLCSNASPWFSILSQTTASTKQDVVIVFTYFLLQQNERLNVIKACGLHICNNIILRAREDMYLPIAQALLFCFVCVAEKYPDDPVVKEANEGVINLVSRFGILNIFRNHSSMLWWIFSSSVPKDWQDQVVSKFLCEEPQSTDAENIFLDVMDKPAQCLLRIAYNGSMSLQKAERALHIYSQALVQKNEMANDLFAILFGHLQYFLGRMVSKERVRIVTNVLELASRCNEPAGIRLNRHATLNTINSLLTVCTTEKHQPLPIIFYKAAMQVALLLLKFSVGIQKDARAMSCFFNNQKFHQLLVHSSSRCPDQDLCLLSQKLISYLLWIQNQQMLTVKSPAITIEIQDLVRCFMTLNSPEVTLQITYMILQTENPTIFTFSQGSGMMTMVQILYYHISTLYAKDCSGCSMSKTCACLERLAIYTYLKGENDTCFHVMTTPWFYKFLILTCITEKHISQKSLNFLEKWLQGARKYYDLMHTFQSSKSLHVQVKKQVKEREKDSRKGLNDLARVLHLVRLTLQKHKPNTMLHAQLLPAQKGINNVL